MNLTISRDDLMGALALVSRAVSARTTLPALGGIYVDAATEQVTFRATDTEMSVTLGVTGAKVERPGTVLLPGRLLVDVARTLPEGDVTLAHRAEQRDVEITAGGARFHLRTLSTEDFPRVPEFEAASAASLPAGPLAETIEKVARAASRDEVRPILTGILVQAEESRLTMVATDSYRLSVKHAQLEQPVSTPIDANVPARALRELSRVIAQVEPETVGISLARGQAVLQAGPVTLSTRLIEGQFPSWRQLIPESFDHEVRLPRGEFVEIARRIGQLAQRNAPLRLAFGEGELTVAAETPEIGDARESMPAPFSGDPMEIAFNPQFLIEGAESVDADELVVKLSSPLRPGLLQAAGSEEFSYLVMPIRLNA